MTATVETMVEHMDVATVMPAESIVAALARSMTVTDADVGKLKTFKSFFVSVNDS